VENDAATGRGGENAANIPNQIVVGKLGEKKTKVTLTTNIAQPGKLQRKGKYS